MVTKVGIVGMPGKMAARLVSLLPEHRGLALGAALGRPGDPTLGADSGSASGGKANGIAVEAFSAEAFNHADVWIEFAQASATRATVAAARAAKKALLVCTTGHDAKTLEAIAAAASDIPVMLAANTSLGVAVLNAALRLALEALGPSYAAEIVELHHDKKHDAPSGTAMRLYDTIHQVRGGGERVTGRAGNVGPRGAGEIGVFAVRGGNVIGEHTVYLIGEHERLELSHRAGSRDLFADGALRAAAWLAQKPAGAYTIEDSLGLGNAAPGRGGST